MSPEWRYQLRGLALPSSTTRQLAKLGKIGSTAGAAAKVSKIAKLLKNSKNVTIADGKVFVKGVEKMSLKDLEKLYEQSVHNMDAKQATLGKWEANSPKSYEKFAEEAGDAHFNLPDGKWGKAKDDYNVTDGDLYELLNKPFLEEIVKKRLPVKFTHDPQYDPGMLGKEFKFLKKNGYKFNEETLTMTPPKR